MSAFSASTQLFKNSFNSAHLWIELATLYKIMSYFLSTWRSGVTQLIWYSTMQYWPKAWTYFSRCQPTNLSRKIFTQVSTSYFITMMLIPLASMVSNTIIGDIIYICLNSFPFSTSSFHSIARESTSSTDKRGHH